MAEPAVTAVIGAYCAGDYLRHAIESVLAQSLTDFEVLVSDDADDPEVRRLVESYRDPRLRYRSNPTRLGPAGNHWVGLSVARGRYAAILNHDDFWRPDYLATAVPVLDATPDAVLVFCDHDVIDSVGVSIPAEADRTTRQWGRNRLTPGLYKPFANLVVRQSIPVAMGCVFRRNEIDANLFPDVGPAYDLWLALALCRTGGGAYYLADRLTAWRVHPGQLTATRDEGWTRGALTCWQAMADEPAFRPFRRTVRWRLSQASSTLGATKLATGNLGAARSAARQALLARPANWRAWAVLSLSFFPHCVAKRVAVGRGYQPTTPKDTR